MGKSDILVFLCYASADATLAELTQMKLEASGFRVWRDARAIPIGDEWRNEIDRGICEAHVLLAILTATSCKSPYVTYEWAYSLGSGTPVLPLLTEDAELHPRLEALQYLDWRNLQVRPWDDLVAQISKIARKRPDDASAMRVKDMSADDLQAVILGAMALTQAGAKEHSGKAEPEAMSKAASSMAAAYQHTREERDPARSDGPVRILWVDDRPANNRYERAAFETIGYEFTLVRSTQEALEVLKGQSFDGVISDMGREEGPREGYALLEVMRSAGDRTPFFIYAGSDSPKHQREAAARGAQGSTNRPDKLFDLVTSTLAARG